MYKEEISSKNNMILNKKYLDYKYSHQEKKSTKYVIGKMNKEIFLTLRDSGFKRMAFKINCQLDKKRIFDKTPIYNSNDMFELEYNCSQDYVGKRVAVYTAIFGGYDKIKEPLYISPSCDYFIFTDQEVPTNSIWKKLDTSIIPNYKEMDAYKLSKYVKLFPDNFFINYDYSIWVDGTATIVADLVPLVDRLGNNFIGVFDNPVHDCIYTEAEFLIYYNRVKENIIKRQISDYRNLGFPTHAGMYECTVIARKHNDKRCIEMMNMWWSHILKYSMRDQISFPVVAWKCNLLQNGITLLGDNRNFNPRFLFDDHIITHKYK